MLGGLEASRDGGPVDLGPPKLRLLLAVLLCRLNQAVPVPDLVDAMWPDDPPDSAVANLRTYVHQLRRTVGFDVIDRHGTGYRLVVAPECVDATRFAARVGQARARVADGDLRAATEEFRLGLALWRGRPFAGLPYRPELARTAYRLEEQRLDALERCMTIELEQDVHAGLVQDLRDAVAEHPFRERLRGQLMTALSRTGRRAEALQAYRDFRTLLVEELGVEPGPDLDEVHRAILRSRPVPGRREAAAPATTTAAVRPAQLPPATMHFVGRDAALRGLDALARDGGPGTSAVMAVVGPPGIGKTATAVRWAHGHADAFADGALFVDLHGSGPRAPVRPHEALGRLLASLGVPPAEAPPDVDTAAAMYRSLAAGKRMVIVLDDARSAEQVRHLLPGTPGPVVVVTSRNGLPGLVAAWGTGRLVLDELSPDEAGDLIAGVAGGERVRAEPAAVRQLAEECERLPLALRIAATALLENPTRTVAGQLAAVRRDRLAALRIGDGSLCLTTALDGSYAHLTASQRRVFGVLARAPGGLTADVVGRLAGTSTGAAAACLTALAREHLVDQPLDGTYVLRGLRREYARSRAAVPAPRKRCAAATAGGTIVGARTPGAAAPAST
jgi:DNA-binding SARP family transcriptional activator